MTNQRTHQEHHSPQCRRSKAQRAANIHRVPQHIEWEPFDTMIHKNTEIVTEERPRDSQSIRRRYHEYLADDEHDRRDHGRVRLWKERNAGLVL